MFSLDFRLQNQFEPINDPNLFLRLVFFLLVKHKHRFVQVSVQLTDVILYHQRDSVHPSVISKYLRMVLKMGSIFPIFSAYFLLLKLAQIKLQ